ncbi:DUF6522 family protein [Paracoccus sp. 22332]|uniref:DUF6522 family protein n=1 Tax=Paracoccus sp. 22332 TaxID=3453913 RepID=UPI003F85AFEA
MTASVPRMKVGFDGDQPVVDAAAIAPLLGLDVPTFQDRMRSGRIRTMIERGEADDAGKLRLTFQTSDWRVRLTCAGDGTVLTLTRAQMGAPGRDAGPSPA